MTLDDCHGQPSVSMTKRLAAKQKQCKRYVERQEPEKVADSLKCSRHPDHKVLEHPEARNYTRLKFLGLVSFKLRD